MTGPRGYETFYNLRASPFALSPDPAFFFASRGHQRAVSYLEYGLYKADGFIVVTGEIGAGKTTLVRHLIGRLNRSTVTVAELFHTQLDDLETLRMAASAFGLPPDDAGKAVVLKRLETFLLAASAAGRRALMVVDEAQNLPPAALEELRMLSNMQRGGRPLLQTFLVGQPQFRRTLDGADMEQLRQRVIASCHLGPLDATETRRYILHRLRTAGWSGDPSFDEPALIQIFAFTAGVPRRINTLCDRLMLMGFVEEKHAFGASEVRDVIEDVQGERLDTEVAG